MAKGEQQGKAFLGRCFMLQGLLEEARELFETALRDSPDSEELLVGLARIDVAAGRWARALCGFRKVRRLNPRNSDALLGAGKLFMSRDRLKAANSCFAAVTRLSPTRQDAWVGLALALWRQGRVDEAETLLSSAVKRRRVALVGFSRVSRRCEALALLACIHLEQGRPGDAAAAVQRIALREVRDGEEGNHLTAFLRATRHPQSPQVLELVATHARRLEERTSRRWVPLRPSEAAAPAPRQAPGARRCGHCGGVAPFVTATGGGAGMVYLIFKCRSCGKCLSVK